MHTTSGMHTLSNVVGFVTEYKYRNGIEMRVQLMEVPSYDKLILALNALSKNDLICITPYGVGSITDKGEVDLDYMLGGFEISAIDAEEA